tara:strand:+ start:154 stop:471 length:318 start_codon:yes stop_codon:yes gene_type:complete
MRKVIPRNIVVCASKKDMSSGNSYVLLHRWINMDSSQEEKLEEYVAKHLVCRTPQRRQAVYLLHFRNYLRSKRHILSVKNVGFNTHVKRLWRNMRRNAMGSLAAS